MQRLTGFIAALFGIFCLAGCGPQEFLVTDKTLALFGVQLQQAAGRRDIKAIADAYAANAVIEIRMPEGSYPFSGTMSRDEYSAKLAELLKQSTRYQLDWADPAVTIAPDEKSAKASALRIERFELPEGAKEFRLMETMELALADRKIVMVRQTLSPAP